jgi:hypothetical protein
MNMTKNRHGLLLRASSTNDLMMIDMSGPNLEDFNASRYVEHWPLAANPIWRPKVKWE